VKQTTLVDWRGGYCSDVSPELMSPQELLTAYNCYFDSGLRKRRGTSSWDGVFGTATSIVGALRVYVPSIPAFMNILALDTGASTVFAHTYASSTATLFSAFNFTTGCNVEFAEMDGLVLAVNGVNKPAIMYCTSTWEIMNLEQYDKRERGTQTWWAGQYDASASSMASTWVSDTDDAQSSATSDFVLSATSTGGFWLACNYTFNKVYLYNCNQVSGTYGAAYQYWNTSSTWTSCDLIASAAFNVATATRTIEWNWASNMGLGDSYFEGYDDLATHYIFRCRMSTGPSASFECGSLAVEHTQYLTGVLGNDRPQSVAVSNRRTFLGSGNNVFVSEYGTPRYWEMGHAEYFLEGGQEIKQMVPHQDYLIVMKENAIFGYYGNSFDTLTRKLIAYGTGVISKRSAAAVGNSLFYVGRTGIFMWDGVQYYNISKHIKSDFDSWIATTAVGFNYKGEYWVSFPSSTVTLRCDPDSFRKDEMGDGRVGWFKMNLGFTQFLYNQDGGDTGNFFGAVKCTATTLGGNHLCQLETAHNGKDRWCGSTTAIDMIMQTGYKVADTYGMQTRYTRILPRISQVSSSVGATVTHALMSNNSSVTVSITQVLNTGTGYDQDYFTIPYTLDGKNLSYYFRHNASQTIHLAGVTFEAEGRYL
jgi:hypothetical protein